jgi:DNA-binding Xre family transcriptional regulator
MIIVKIQEVAKAKGITTGYQFQRISGFPPAMAARIFKGNWTRIDTKTLNAVCNVLKCTPNDILEFTPDELEE